MLVLSRQLDEEIVIGDSIRLKVVALSGHQVRLGIVAPAEIPIMRAEIYEAIARQNETAAAASPETLHDVLQSRRKA
jgi:carbon storage regulator